MASGQIRTFVETDRTEWLRLCLALFPHTEAADHESAMHTFLDGSDAKVFVIERPNGLLAGFVEVGSRPYVDGCDSSPVGYIEAWYVDEDVRRTGLGRQLLAAAESWAREQGYSEMGSDAQLVNDVSHAAHARCGYMEVDRVVQYRKSLAD